MMLALAVMLAAAGANAPPVVHPVPAGMRHNDDFTVRVREPGGRWQDLYEHAVIVAGFDASRTVSGVTIEGLTIGGRRIGSAAEADAAIGPFVQGVTFRLARPIR